jgi:hypothetical protein
MMGGEITHQAEARHEFEQTNAAASVPERVSTFVSSNESSATTLYGVAVDYGWCERILCSGSYEHDAKGLAHAFASVYGCEVI